MRKTICFEFVTLGFDTFEEFNRNTDNLLSVWLAVTMVMSEWVFMEHSRQSVTYVQNFSHLSQFKVKMKNKGSLNRFVLFSCKGMKLFPVLNLKSNGIQPRCWIQPALTRFKLPDNHAYNDDGTPLLNTPLRNWSVFTYYNRVQCWRHKQQRGNCQIN